MNAIKIDGLWSLVDFESKQLYPRIFLSKEDADKTNKILGNSFKLKEVFINN